MDKIAIARRQMDKIPLMYDRLMRMHPDGMPSIGLVARFDKNGGGSGRTGSLVETVAMRSLNLSDAQKLLIEWMDVVTDVYSGLITSNGKNGIKLQHDRKLGAVLKGKVFDGLTFERIKEDHFRQQVSNQYVQKLYGDVVELVAQEAERRGLYRRMEGHKTQA